MRMHNYFIDHVIAVKEIVLSMMTILSMTVTMKLIFNI